VTCNNVLLIAAGGGGGATSDNNGANSTTLTSGTNDYPGGSTPGGTGGGGGSACNVGGAGANHGGGGGGYSGDGATSTANSPGGGGFAFLNGGMGGTSFAVGGFGGGGGATSITVGGGGGGGYSGGAGGQQVNYCTPGINRSGGGGGGSYNTGANQVNAAGVNTGDGKVIIKGLCNIEITATGTSTLGGICAGNSATLSTNAVSNISWTGGSSSTTIVVSPTATTVYSVTGTSTAACTAASFYTVTINPLPVISANSTPSVLCVGATATLQGSGAVTYTWSTGATGVSATVAPLTNAQYTVTGTSAFGCVNNQVVGVQVNTLALIVTPTSTVCLGESKSIGVSGALSYTWAQGGSFSSINVTPLVNTNYSVSGTDIHNCVLSAVVSLVVSPKPVVTITADRTVICKGETVQLTGGGANSYTWSGGGGTQSTFTTVLTADVPYTFTVTGMDNAGCVNTAVITIPVVKCTGIDEGAADSSIRVFPNPGSGIYHLQLTGASEKIIEVSDITGKVICFSRLSGQAGTVDISSSPAGIYFLKVNSESTTKVIRLVKE
jgi:hypothetical protein